MIISRTPFRVSFAGGGTDLSEFYLKEDGQVLNTTIDKYLFVAVKPQTCLAESKFRINWSQVEFKDSIDEIEHPIVREALRMMDMDIPLEISTFADIPSQTGLGSSSAFAVGLLHALFAVKGQLVPKGDLADMAARIEVNILGRSIGKQDHYAAAFGNLNVYTFHKDESVSVDPVLCRGETKRAVGNNIMMFYTDVKRDANEILKNQKAKMSEKHHVLVGMRDMVEPLRNIFSTGANLHEIGKLLHDGWGLKRSITEEISSPDIDKYYERAMNAGALGGKLLGAGGGGFLLLYVEPQNQKAVAENLSELYQLPFGFDNQGSQITYFDQPLS